jgi:hypothetical protein
MSPHLRPEDFAVLVRVAQELRRDGSSRTLEVWRQEARGQGQSPPAPPVPLAYAQAVEAAGKVAQMLVRQKFA